jgi:aspartyl-tRNA(Asn)/glutamyl-tRNA(Gln) amidotransferase subunit C
MPEVNEALIRKVADLARLELKESEIQEYVKSIGDILKHVDQLSSAKVDGVEPMIHGVDGTLRLRPDEIIAFPTDEHGKPKVLQSAPEVMYDGYKVPQIL